MKSVLLTCALLILSIASKAQTYTGKIDVLTVHSQNGSFYLRSVPFDNESPSLRGVTRVYSTRQSVPLYEFEIGFDSVEERSNNLILSDDGETIFHAITWMPDEEKEELRSVTIYRHGRLHASYTRAAVTGCGNDSERCSLVYSNYNQVVDREKSKWGTAGYRKVFKEDVSEEEKFLSDFAIFANGDTVYLTDSNRRTHFFDLQQGVMAGSGAFDDLYSTLKELARFTFVELKSYDAPSFDDFPRLKDGREPSKALARYLGMNEFDVFRPSDRKQYKSYEIKVRSNLLRDGSLELEEIEVEEGLPRDRIVEFFKSARFDIGNLPAVLEKWHVGILDGERFYLRKSDRRVARSELKVEQAKEARLELGTSAVLDQDRLIHLDESGRVRVWRLRDGGFDPASTAEFAKEGLIRLASDGSGLWAVSTSNVYRWSSEDRAWKGVATLNQDRHVVRGFAVAGGAPLLVLTTGVMNPMKKQMYAAPRTAPLSRTVAVLGTESALWIGTSSGEWGGTLHGLDPANGTWVGYDDSLHYVTGITQDRSGEVVVSWSMSHFDADTMIRMHRQNAAASRDFPELQRKYYQTVAFNPFDGTLYGVEQRDVVTISDGIPTKIAELDGRVYGKEAMALGVAPGIGGLLPFAPRAFVIVPKAGMPWMLREGALTRLSEP